MSIWQGPEPGTPVWLLWRSERAPNGPEYILAGVYSSEANAKADRRTPSDRVTQELVDMPSVTARYA